MITLSARLHPTLNAQIDYSIFIDTPLDIAMARWIFRDFKLSIKKNIFEEINYYLSESRNSYFAMLEKEKNNFDVIIDGKQSIVFIVQSIMKFIKN